MSTTVVIPFPGGAGTRCDRDKRVLDKLQQELVDDGYPQRRAFQLASLALEIANSMLGRDSLRTT